MNGPHAEAMAEALLHFVWQGAVLGLATFALLRCLERGSAAARYLIACAGLLLMALAVPLTFLFVLPAPSSATVPFEILPDFAASTLTFTPSPAQSPVWLSVVLYAWLCGVAVFSCRAAGGWCLAAYRVQSGRKPVEDAIRHRIQALAGKLGIRRSVRAFESSRVAVPCAFGLFRSVLLLPTSALTGLSPAQLDAILAHELAHIARHDFLVNCLQSVVEALLFYHPAVWWLSARIRRERELCCDAVAVATCGDGLAYARALLALEEGRQSFVLAASGGDLRNRIARLLAVPGGAGRQPAPWFALLVAGCAAVVMAAPVLLAQRPASATSEPREVILLATPEERRQWSRLQTPAERERFLVDFWRNRGNETKIEHKRRIDYANERFSTQGSDGWNTDRGRTYIKYGPPAEITSRPSIQNEIWRYSDGREFEFNGADFHLDRVRMDGVDYLRRASTRGAGFSPRRTLVMP